MVREDEKSTDLFDLLQNSARESYSSPQIPGVSPCVCDNVVAAQSCATAVYACDLSAAILTLAQSLILLQSMLCHASNTCTWTSLLG